MTYVEKLREHYAAVRLRLGVDAPHKRRRALPLPPPRPPVTVAPVLETPPPPILYESEDDRIRACVLRAREMMTSQPGFRRAMVMAAVAQCHGISLANILSKNRQHCFARPRQLAMALMREIIIPAPSWMQIGFAFNRDHTTALYAHGKLGATVRRVLAELDAGGERT